MIVYCSRHGDTIILDVQQRHIGMIYCKEFACTAPLLIQDPLPELTEKEMPYPGDRVWVLQ